MDSITQAALGAAIGHSLISEKIGKKGALLGAIVATVPDLDVILYLFYDKLDMLSIHRGFSHSLVFSLLGALLIAVVLNRIKWFRNVKFKILLLFSWLCLFTHMLLDTFTAYGTQLYLPFSKKRIGFDSINVVDPLYTIPLLIGLFLSLFVYSSKSDSTKYNTYGIVISSLYLIFTLINKEIVNSKISERLSDEKIEYNSLLTMPVGIANINWYGVAKSQDSIYMLQHSVLLHIDNSIEVFPINDEYLNLIDQRTADKMRWFAKGYYTVEKVNDKIRIYNLQVDMRGIIKTENIKAPTAGYFEIENINGISKFSSGSIDSK